MSEASKLYRKHHIKGHPVQYFTTALLIKHLSTKYPKAWGMNGMSILLVHIHNLDMKERVNA